MNWKKNKDKKVSLNFNNSIYENLTLGDTIPLEKIKKIAQDIEVDEFIERFF